MSQIILRRWWILDRAIKISRHLSVGPWSWWSISWGCFNIGTGRPEFWPRGTQVVLRAQGMQMLMGAYKGHMKGEFSPVPQNKMDFSGTDLFQTKKKHLNYHHNLLVLLETSLSPFCASGNHILPAIKEGKLIQCRVPHGITTPLSSNPSAVHPKWRPLISQNILGSQETD